MTGQLGVHWIDSSERVRKTANPLRNKTLYMAKKTTRSRRKESQEPSAHHEVWEQHHDRNRFKNKYRAQSEAKPKGPPLALQLWRLPRC